MADIEPNQGMETLSVKEKHEDQGKPYFYHTRGVGSLETIFRDGRLKNPDGKPVMFTADSVDEETGNLQSNGLTDSAYDALVGRKFEPGRVIFVFDKSVRDNPGFIDVDETRRYPQVQEQPTEKVVAVLAFEEDMPKVWQSMREAGVDIPIVTKSDWEQYAYGGVTAGLADTDSDLVGGLADPEAVLEEDAPGADREENEVVRAINSKPENLLEMSSIKVKDLFGLDWEKVFLQLRNLQILSSDNPATIKWNKVREIKEMGEKEFLRNNPGLEVIELD